MKKPVFILILLVSGIFFGVTSVFAQTNVDVDVPEVSIKPITIPLFGAPIDLGNFSIFSWLVFLGGLVISLLVIYWIFLFVRTGLKAIQSNGKPEVLAEVGKSAQSILVGIAITFLIPIVLSLVGYVLGIGNVFAWPKMFSLCGTIPSQNSSQITKTFYFQYYLENPETAESQCNYYVDPTDKTIDRFPGRGPVLTR